MLRFQVVIVGFMIATVLVTVARAEELAEAKAAYLESVADARDRLDTAINDTVQSLREAGDKDLADELTAQLDRFWQDLTPPRHRAIEKVNSAYRGAIKTAKLRLLRAYTDRVNQLKDDLRLDQAETLRKERNAFAKGEFSIEESVGGKPDQVAVVATAPKVQLGPNTKFQTIGIEFPNTTRGPQVKDLNNKGELTGTVETDTGRRGFIWSQGKVTLINPKDQRHTALNVFGINDNSTVIGIALDGGASSDSEGFVWSKGKLRVIETYGNNLTTNGLFYNVTTSSLVELGNDYRVKKIANLKYAARVNNRGIAVGHQVTGDGQTACYIARPANGWKPEIFRPFNAIRSKAKWISDTGVIVGIAEIDEGGVRRKVGFILDGKELKEIPGVDEHYFEPVCVNNHGQVVGRVGTPRGHTHAALYSEGRTIDLTTLIPPRKYVMTSASRINDRGEILVGYNWDPFLLRPIAQEPGK